MRVKKLLTKNKNQQQTESGDKVLQINPSEQDWLKHRLINADAASVLIRYAWETAWISKYVFQEKKLQLKMLPF